MPLDLLPFNGHIGPRKGSGRKSPLANPHKPHSGVQVTCGQEVFPMNGPQAHSNQRDCSTIMANIAHPAIKVMLLKRSGIRQGDVDKYDREPIYCCI